MRVLFVYKAPSPDIRDPLGLLYIISIARRQGHDCLLLIPNLERRFVGKAIEFKPDIVCYSVTTGTEDEYLRINSALKQEMSFFSAFGGPHPTFYPEFIQEEGVDAICRGEAEESFEELLNRFENGKEIYDVPNFWFKRGNEIVRNELRPLEENLDTIPFPDRDLINTYFHYEAYGSINIITGRGCPFNCTYCFNHKLREYYSGKGRYVRKRSVDNVISELKDVRERFGVKEIYFVDDLFTVKGEWLAEFAEKYSKDINLPYMCHLRADLVTEETVEHLKESNCRYVGFGIESGNYRLRKEILNRDITNEQIYRTAVLLRKHGIRFGTANMIGLPYETVEEAFETVNVNIKCAPDYAWISILQPYPGTELHRFSVENKLLRDDYSIESNYHSSSPYKSKHIRQLENLHYLFAAVVQHPFLLPVVKRMIKLPKNIFFKVVHDGYKFYEYIRIGQFNLNRVFMKNLITMIYIKIVEYLKALFRRGCRVRLPL